MIYARNRLTGEHRVVGDGDGWLMCHKDWECIYATPDGWIEWDAKAGAESPVASYTGYGFATMRLADGEEIDAVCDWDDSPAPSRLVIAYRPILDADEPEVEQGTGSSASRCPFTDSSGRPGSRLGPFLAGPPAWDGEGLPPVGCECEVLGAPGGTFCPAVIDYIDDRHCVWHWLGSAPDDTMHNRVERMRFRPIRSEENRAVEEMVPILRDATKQLGSSKAKAAARALYRAGYRKTGGE